MLFWTRRMQLQHPRRKTRQGAENLVLTRLKMMKTFICFPKQFFLHNDFIDAKKAVLKGRPKFSRSITGNDRKKVHKKCKNVSKLFSSKCSYGEVESSLQAPLTFFGQPAESFPLDIQKNNNL